MMSAIERIVIVGGGLVAARCAFELRARGYDRRIVVLSEETEAPYDRTLVSKDLLAPDPPDVRELLLELPESYEADDVDLRLACPAVGLDWRARQVLLRSGKKEPYDRLVIASGGRARRPVAWPAAGATTLRSGADATRLARALDTGGHVAIIGGGFVGAEVASAARARGLMVTMIEELPAPLARALGAEVGRRLAALHQANGVRLLANERVEAITTHGAVTDVRLAGGDRVSASTVVIAVGMEPATNWLAGAPITVRGLVQTDEYCETSITGVFAAGDAAAWFDERCGRHVRFEHWDTAQRHADVVAANVLGARQAFRPIPYFWSDQHSVKLQLVGDPAAYERVQIEDLDPPHSFVAHYHRDGRHTATFAADQPHAIAAARRELHAGAEMAAVT